MRWRPVGAHRAMAPLATLPVLAVMAGAAAPVHQHGVPDHYWDLHSGTTCNGEQELYEKCPNMPACTPCVPKPCAYSAWGDWEQGAGCSGVAIKTRTYSQSNECGKPCTGPLKWTKKSYAPNCVHTVGIDCVLTAWSAWAQAECTNQWAQKSRVRSIKSQAKEGGKPCSGVMKETNPCKFVEPPQDCQWGDWSVYTACSKTCGPGRHTRVRRVFKESRHGGETCDGGTTEVANCTAAPCPGGVVDCQTSAWSLWSRCDSSSPIQKHRSRSITAAAKNGGTLCNAPLKELGQCNLTSGSKLVCSLTDWAPWSVECDKTCNGGQKYRHKVLENPGGMGTCAVGSMREIAPCNVGVECRTPLPGEDCELSTWGPWGECSSKCGTGVRIRTRTASDAKCTGAGNSKKCGLPCGDAQVPSTLEEVASCVTTGAGCLDVNCRWADWETWSGCTTTCGGGTKRRHRHVNQAPANKGRKCDAKVKAEIASCNAQACVAGCVDAEWGSWSSWSKCSVTCGRGYKSRTRHVNQEPNECGKQISGPEQNYTECDGAVRRHCITPKDCTLGAWDTWSACTATCFGIQETNRVIEQFPQGDGAACPEVQTRIIRPCNPILGQAANPMCNNMNPKKDCVLSPWGEWSTCSESCGRGQRHRVRFVKQPPMHSGKECPPVLSMTEGCGEQPCADNANKCIDCVMGTWGEWSACTKSGNQKRRTRAISKRRNQCGQECTETTTKEIAICDSDANRQGMLYCHWKDWGDWAACPSGCGAAVTRRHRSLQIATSKPAVPNGTADPTIFTSSSGTGNIVCSGHQTDVHACANPQACHPGKVRINCDFTPWTSWTASNSAGLCRRNRHVLTVNKNGGTPCVGALMGTQRCQPRTKSKLDCQYSSWGMWSQCSNPAMQRFRIRAIRQMPQAGGKPCPGSTLLPFPLRETAPCARQSNAVDCHLSDWGAWGVCSRSCNAGWQIKTRRILVAAKGGGMACNGTLELMQACETQGCPNALSQPCVLGDWGGWSGCHQNGQKYQERSIATEASGPGASGCQGEMQRTAGCSEDRVDCEMAQWTDWMQCSMSCRGGTMLRHRQVNRWPINGGLPCEASMNLTELAPCNENTFCQQSKDCVVAPWTTWSTTCSTACGPGQITRTRTVQSNRQGNGMGCVEDLVQTRPCTNRPSCTTTNCVWHDWQMWSDCTKTLCGGGIQIRKRSNTPPQHGGTECTASFTQEQRSCNTDVCASAACTDGSWKQWEDWAPCSQTCRGGTTWRLRQIGVTASSCGKPAVGFSQQAASCNENVACKTKRDCVMEDWGAWSACSETCFGTKRRSRAYVGGQGDGTFCSGALRQAAPCQSATQPAPAGCTSNGAPVDCALNTWDAWSACTATCGVGQLTRQRTVLTNSANGGKACNDALFETKGCDAGLCSQPCGIPTCMWTAWSSWSPCNQCGGQRTRIRHVTPPAAGGTRCEMRAAEETTGCPSHCHDHYYCAWAAWEAWSACTGCGNVYKKRRRVLALDVVPAGTSRAALYETDGEGLGNSELQERFQQLWRQNKKEEEARTQQIVGAFAAGGLCLVLALLIMKVVVPRPATGVTYEGHAMYPTDSDSDQVTGQALD